MNLQPNLPIKASWNTQADDTFRPIPFIKPYQDTVVNIIHDVGRHRLPVASWSDESKRCSSKYPDRPGLPLQPHSEPDSRGAPPVFLEKAEPVRSPGSEYSCSFNFRLWHQHSGKGNELSVVRG